MYTIDFVRGPKVPPPNRIVITGASSGIGEATAVAYAKSGNTLYLISRNKLRLDAVATACKSRGANVITKLLDVRNKEEMRSFLLECDNCGPIDLVIANAGIMIPTCGATGDVEQMARELYGTNVNGTLNTVLPLLPRMVSRHKGQVALLSSGAGLGAIPFNPLYSPTKVAIMSLGEALRCSVRDEGVHVSVISPGAIKTPMTHIPIMESQWSGLPSVEGMANAIVKGLENDEMVIAHTQMQFWAVCTFIRNIPYAVKDYATKYVLTPIFKKTGQYFIEVNQAR